MEQKQRIKNARKTLRENERFYKSSVLLRNLSSTLLPQDTFIDLLNDGATKLEFKGTVVIDEKELHEYHAKYLGKEIVMMTDNKIYNL